MDTEGWLAPGLVEALVAAIADAYARERPLPRFVPAVPAIPDRGLGPTALPGLWKSIVSGSTALGSPLMAGHMDTAPHPAAALTDALVSALNNNLLFRELSPFASAVEEQLCAELGARLGLPETARGTFASGGSLANLTALFAACGGFDRPIARDHVRLLVPECAHTSVAKAAAVLGVGNVVTVPGDEQGRMDPQALLERLLAGPRRHDVVVAVLGSTVHGAVESLDPLVRVCDQVGAWLHVDAVYGGALAFSRRHRALLAGLECVDSVAIGPQKWLYVPRLSALVYLRDARQFERRLGRDMPYSTSGDEHRGRFGLQGSRRADAVTLWATLQVLGADGLAVLVDGAIERAASLHALARDHAILEPTHVPDLNLQCLRLRGRRAAPEEMRRLHARLESAGGAWLSLASWRGETLLRSVLLSADADDGLAHRLLDDVAAAATA